MMNTQKFSFTSPTSDDDQPNNDAALPKRERALKRKSFPERENFIKDTFQDKGCVCSKHIQILQTRSLG